MSEDTNDGVHPMARKQVIDELSLALDRQLLGRGGLKVLVCGGRRYNDVVEFNALLDHYHKREVIDCVIHGDASGADTLAKEWARAHGIVERAYPADWKRYGVRAGPIRNQLMLDAEGPDVVIAFPGGPGTNDMKRRARLAGVRVCD